MAGNKLGKKKYYKYVSDSGTEYSYLTDIDLATASGAVADDSLPGFPRRFRPRATLLRDATGSVKRLIMPTIGAALYDTDVSGTVTIDGTEFKSTGRVGERMSFATNPSA